MNRISPVLAVIGQAAFVAYQFGNGSAGYAAALFALSLFTAVMCGAIGILLRLAIIEAVETREYHKRLKSKGLWATIALVALFATTAEACPRCGLFGNKCAFASHHVAQVQQVAYTPPAAASQNFIFNNAFAYPGIPPYQLSQQGNSVYGVSLASQPYELDANLFMDRSARQTELAMQSANQGQQIFAANTAQAMAFNDAADRRAKNTFLAAAAMQANSDPGQTSKPLSFQATVTNGRLSIRQIEGGQAGSALTGSGPRGPTGRGLGAVVLGACSRCHDGSGANGTPQGLILDGRQQLTKDQFDACIAKMRTGAMPPPDKSEPLSPSQAVEITAALCSLKDRPLITPEPNF